MLAGTTFLFIFQPIDYTHYRQQEYYKSTVDRLNHLPIQKSSGQQIKCGWASENITPSQPMSLVAYQYRGKYTSIEDSIKVKVLTFVDPNLQVSIVSFDLLLVHSHLKQAILKRLKKAGLDAHQVYFTATHSHNSIGGFAPGFYNSFIFGNYNPKYFELLCNKTIKAIQRSITSASPAQYTFKKVNTDILIHNRLLFHDRVDGAHRLLFIKNQQEETAVFDAFNAHPTVHSSHFMSLGNDYVTPFRKKLKENLHCDFSIFSAGAVGSHAPWAPKDWFKTPREYAFALADKISDLLKEDTLNFQPLKNINYSRLKIDIGEPQIHALKKHSIRPYLSQLLYDKNDIYLNFLTIENKLLAGTPCDFSGIFQEMDSTLYQNIIPTSFNGTYTGYATPSDFFGFKDRETRHLNWVSPFYGDYLNELITTYNSKKTNVP